MRNLFLRIFPPRRRELKWHSFIMPVLFPVLFLSISFYLDYSGKILFTRPLAFVLTVILPWFWWMIEMDIPASTGSGGFSPH